MSRHQAQPGVMPAAMSDKSDFERAIAAPGVVPVAIRTRRAGLRRSIRKTAVAVVGAVALTAAATPTANAQWPGPTGAAGSIDSPCSTEQGAAIGLTGNVPVEICSGGGPVSVAPVTGQIASVTGPAINSPGVEVIGGQVAASAGPAITVTGFGGPVGTAFRAPATTGFRVRTRGM